MVSRCIHSHHFATSHTDHHSCDCIGDKHVFCMMHDKRGRVALRGQLDMCHKGPQLSHRIYAPGFHCLCLFVVGQQTCCCLFGSVFSTDMLKSTLANAKTCAAAALQKKWFPRGACITALHFEPQNMQPPRSNKLPNYLATIRKNSVCSVSIIWFRPFTHGMPHTIH